MRQILQNLKNGEMELVKVPCPNAERGMVLIQSSRSLISAGTERMMVEFSKANIIRKVRSQPDKVRQVLDKITTDGLLPTLDAIFRRLDEPLPLGYCNAGKVIAVGPGVHDLRQDDRVVSNGAHAEIVCVPRNLVAKIPDGVEDEKAAFTVLGAVGLQGIRLAQPTLGEGFMVFGAGLLGLMTVQMLRANGCRVMAVDINAERLKLAEFFGASITDISAGEDVVAAAQAFSGGIGVDGVLICASAETDEIMHLAAASCRKRGRIILVGVSGLKLRREDFYKKELTFQVSCSYGPGRYDENYEQAGQDYPVGYVRWTEGRNFEAVLGMMSEGTLDVKPLVTHRFPINKALEAYQEIQNNPGSIGVILEYPERVNQERQIILERPHDKRAEKKEEKYSIGGRRQAVVGVIGSGNFAKSTMLPALIRTGVRLKYIAGSINTAGLTHVGRKFHVERAVSDFRVVLEDSEVNTVFILTRHNTHARFVLEALESGKNVFVEKPLCLNENELNTIQKKYEGMDLTRPLLMVGFNRRFSPHTLKVKEMIAHRNEPVCMNMTVNAGAVPREHWIQRPDIGGGRIIGEGCHFIDMLLFLAGVPVVQVMAMMAGVDLETKEDRMSIQLRFADGSIGVINYFANGSKSYPKEIFEVFSEGRVLRIENFRQTAGFGCKGFRRFRTRSQDKGHNSEIGEFIRCVETYSEVPIPFNELVNVTRVSFAAVESAKKQQVINFSI